MSYSWKDVFEDQQKPMEAVMSMPLTEAVTIEYDGKLFNLDCEIYYAPAEPEQEDCPAQPAEWDVVSVWMDGKQFPTNPEIDELILAEVKNSR